jgi:Trk K+ transport system NAD-binding subunit
VFLVGSVYVLLAAGIDLGELRNLFPEGLIVVGALVVVGRPLLVVLSAWGSSMSWRERVFLSAVAPRGVVAASLAGVVALEATPRLGSDEGQIVSMVFVVIGMTIAVQSAYAGPLARWLKVFPMTTVVVGAGETGRRLASKIVSSGEDVRLIDRDEGAVQRAREEGFEVVLGDVTEVDVMKKARMDEATRVVITLQSDDQALLVARHATSTFGVKQVVARVDKPENESLFRELGVAYVSPSQAMASEMALVLHEPQIASLLAGVEEDFEAAQVTVTNPAAEVAIEAISQFRGTLVVLLRRGPSTLMPNGKTRLQVGDTVTIFGRSGDLARARAALVLEGATN